MKLTIGQKKELIAEMRKIYEVCESAGYTPSGNFVAMGQQLKAEIKRGAYGGDDAEELYQAQTMEQVEEWLQAVETNIDHEDRGGTSYNDKEKIFIEDMRSQVCNKPSHTKPLTGNQLKWLKALYDKS